MHEAGRTQEFVKNLGQEQRLQNLNELLAPLERQLITGFDKPQLPVVFIVGVPRSGSTLLAQLLARTGSFSYISNFTARFWLAPYLGILMEEALNIGDGSSSDTFASRYGTTEGWSGPHEFGYFWSRWYHFGQTHKLGAQELAAIDGVTLQKELAALESIYHKPLFFKNMTCGLQIPYLADLIEKSIFVLCRRHPLYNMQSLLVARERILGDRQHWWSLRPKEYADLLHLSPYEQVAGQVFYILQEIEASFARLSPGRFVQVRYEEFCTQPGVEIKKISKRVERLGARLEFSLDPIPDRFEVTNIRRVSPEEFQKLHQAARRYFEARELE